MPGEGYVLFEGPNPPSTGEINAARGKLIWKRPSGEIYLASKPGVFQPVAEEQFAQMFPPAVPEAEAQAAAIEGAQPVAAEPLAAPAAPGVTAQDATGVQANRARFTNMGAMAAEQQRAGTEAAVQAAAAEQRRQEADPYFGIDIGERGMVTQLQNEMGIPEEEAIALYKERRDAAVGAQADAQASALEGAPVE
jgi:hypothetical protein